MKKHWISMTAILLSSITALSFASRLPFGDDPIDTTGMIDAQKKKITVRTENYPRPPYSGATYYLYESDDKVICTKLEVCNKFNECSTTYKKGAFKEDEDVQTGDPYGKTDPVVIASAKLKKHVCLIKFKLVP